MSHDHSVRHLLPIRRGPTHDRQAASRQPSKHHLRKPGSMQERSELGRSVKPHMPRLEPTEQPIREAGGQEIRTRITDHETTVRSEDTSHLSHRLKRIGIVMERVGAEHGRELAIAERKLLRVSDLEPHVLKSFREVDGLTDHLGGQIDADDGVRQVGGSSRCRAGSATDVEQPILGGERERVERATLNGIPPPRREATLVASGPTVEPASGRSLR